MLELRSGDQPAKAGAEISDRVSASTPVFMRNMIFLSSYVIIIIDNNRNPPVGKTQNYHRSYGDIGLEQENDRRPVEDQYRDDDALERYLQEENLALVPLDFMRELMVLMEEHVRRETGVNKDELDEIVMRLEELIGEDGMMDLSMEALVGWVNTLKNS